MLWKIFAAIIILTTSSLISAAVGLIIGALIGGNFFPNFVLFGLRGYEAMGVLGFILGFILGIITPTLLFGSRFIKWLQ
jgi:hypothetical protein